MQNELFFKQYGTCGAIVLDRPKALNALSLSMVKALLSQLKAWDQDPKISHIVIYSSQSKAFCAGGDIKSLYHFMDQGQGDQAAHFFDCEYELNKIISALSKPYIALMEGVTMGGGVGISLWGSHPLVCQTTRFAMPETTIGFFPDIGSAFVFARMEKAVGIYLALTGRSVAGEQLLDYALVLGAFDHNKKEALLKTLYEAQTQEQAQAALRQFSFSFEKPLEGVKELEEEQEKIRTCFSFETVEGIFAALADDGSSWSEETLKHLKMLSPSSLKVTLRHVLEAGSLSFEQQLEADRVRAQSFLERPDFKEGIRARLIDKDFAPCWSPQTLEEVSAQDVEQYFALPKSELVKSEP